MPNRFKIGDEVIVHSYYYDDYNDEDDDERYDIGWCDEMTEEVMEEVGVVIEADDYRIKIKLHNPDFTDRWTNVFWIHQNDLGPYDHPIVNASLDDFFKVM